MTNAEFAILSLIVEKARHGYEIEQVLAERGMREWTEVGFSSIYYLLKKLEKEALIAHQIEQPAGRGPARKVYQITAEGRQACRQATLDALASPHRCYPPIQLGLANLPQVTSSEAIAALAQHQDELAQRHTQLQDLRETQRPLPYFVEAMFDHSLTMIEAERSWINTLIQELEIQNAKD